MHKRTQNQQIKDAHLRFLTKLFGEEKKMVVFGEGDLDAAVMLVGQAPGEAEVLSKRPFAGKNAEDLEKILQALSLSRETVYVTNAVKYRLMKENPHTGRQCHRLPDHEEIVLGRGCLRDEIEMVKPRIIVSLGNTALLMLNGADKKIGRCHGKPQSIQLELSYAPILFPLYHPAALRYHPALMKQQEKDLHVLHTLLLDTPK